MSNGQTVSVFDTPKIERTFCQTHFRILQLLDFLQILKFKVIEKSIKTMTHNHP